jgi:hypothetical protein
MLNKFIALFILAFINPSSFLSCQLLNPVDEIGNFINDDGGEFQIDSILIINKTNSLEKLKCLSLDARNMIKSLYIRARDIAIIPSMSFLPFLFRLQISGIESFENIDNLRNSSITILNISRTSVSNISALSSCINLRDILLNNTKVTQLPDMSQLDKLFWLSIGGTPMRSLQGVETIPNEFRLFLYECNDLVDLDPLLESNVRDLYIDEGNYERLRPWFDRNLPVLESRNPNFTFGFRHYE